MDPVMIIAIGIVGLFLVIRQLMRGLIAHYLPPENDEKELE